MNFFLKILLRVKSWPRLRLLRPCGLSLDWGDGNTVRAPGRMIATVRVQGAGNVIDLDKTAQFKGFITIIGTNNRVIVGKNCQLTGEILVKGKNQTVTIGDETAFLSVYLLCMENKDVTIGRSCLFSRDIEIRTSDAHALVDNKTRKRLNPAASVVIGDHVWVGVGALISKGSVIPDDSVVGAKSFVNKAFDEKNIAIAGTPARIVRRGVTWNRGRKQRYSHDLLNAWRTPSDEG